MNVIKLSHYLREDGLWCYVASCAGRVAVETFDAEDSEPAISGICYRLAESLKIVGNYTVQEVHPDEHDTDE